MKISFKAVAASLAAMLLLAAPASAGIVIDLDSDTPGIQRFDDPLAPFELDTPTQTLNISIWYDSTIPGSTLTTSGEIATIGTSLHWTNSPGVSVVHSGVVTVGEIADMPTFNNGIAAVSDIDGGFGLDLDVGDALGIQDLGTLAGFDDSIGAVGVTDVAGLGFNPSLAAGTVELFKTSFTISGTPGDLVTFTPVGILGISGSNQGELVLDGAFAAQGNINAPSNLADLVPISGIAAVPEPSSFALLTLVGFGATRFRKRRS